MIDYMIMEAVMIKTQEEDRKAQADAQEAAERERWRKNRQDLKEQISQTGQQ